MSWIPTTPTKSSSDGPQYPASVATLLSDKSPTSNGVQPSDSDPSPASTSGVSATSDNLPSTPSEINGLSHSVNHIQLKETCSSSRTSYGAIQYHGDENALEVNASDLSPGQVTAISKYRVSRATEGLSHSSTIDQRLNSSPNVMRFKNHQETVDWRARSDPFSTVPQTDPFMVESTESNIAFRPRGDRIGHEISADNAQALLPPNACVFVANLSSTRTDEQLETSVKKAFLEYGKVYVKIRRDNRSMPYAFCQYEHVTDSERAIEYGRGVIIDGRPCRTERAKVNRSLYLSRVTGGSITELEAKNLLVKFGSIEKVWYSTPTDMEMFRLPQGIWVMYAYFQDARDAQAGMKDDPRYRLEQPAMPDDIRSRLSRAYRSPATRSATQETSISPASYLRSFNLSRNVVLVSNLPASVTQAQLRQLFRTCGPVRGIEIVSKSSSIESGPKIFAFVEFGGEYDAMMAVAREFTLEGTRLRVELRDSTEGIGLQADSAVSSGSPRARGVNASLGSMPGLVDTSVAMGRALSIGIHPAAASFVFFGLNGTQTPAATVNTVAHPSSIANPTAMTSSAVGSPGYCAFQYPPYYQGLYTPYGSSTNNIEAEVPESATRVYPRPSEILQPDGSFPYGPMAAATYAAAYAASSSYQPSTPYVYPNPEANSEALGVSTSPEEIR